MKSTIFIAMILITISGLNLQCGPKPQATVAPSISSLLGQLTSAINPAAFTDAWAGSKGNFTNGLSSVGSASGIAGSVSTLAAYIKPEMFKPGITPQAVADSANQVTDMEKATRLLRGFEGNLRPEA